MTEKTPVEHLASFLIHTKTEIDADKAHAKAERLVNFECVRVGDLGQISFVPSKLAAAARIVPSLVRAEDVQGDDYEAHSMRSEIAMAHASARTAAAYDERIQKQVSFEQKVDALGPALSKEHRAMQIENLILESGYQSN